LIIKDRFRRGAGDSAGGDAYVVANLRQIGNKDDQPNGAEMSGGMDVYEDS